MQERTVWLSCLMYCVKHQKSWLNIFNQQGYKSHESRLERAHKWIISPFFDLDDFQNYFLPTCSPPLTLTPSSWQNCIAEAPRQQTGWFCSVLSPSWLYHAVSVLDTQLRRPSQDHEAYSPQQVPERLIILLCSYAVNLSKGSFKKWNRAEILKLYIGFIPGPKTLTSPVNWNKRAIRWMGDIHMLSIKFCSAFSLCFFSSTCLDFGCFNHPQTDKKVSNIAYCLYILLATFLQKSCSGSWKRALVVLIV